jgi:ABC-2 type transport system ATP-binding protein
MRQRLCLAHVLVHDPQILLLDEPASGLDPRARVEMRELLRELRAMGKTIVVSSHILAELAELCDSVGIIERGRLVASGPLAEIRRHARRGRTLRLKVISDREEAESVLCELAGTNQVFQADGYLEVDFLGDDEAAAGLLQNLVARGIRVASFSEVDGDLEDVFLQLTAL